MPKKTKTLYEKDFYAWAIHNAQLLKKEKLSEIDSEHLAEEIESMGKSEKRELFNRLAILLAHLLEWKYQPAKQSKSWQLTIKEQRFEFNDLLSDSPSLKPTLIKKFSHAYQKALLLAEKETGLFKKTFPKECPFSLKQALQKEYFPK